jgi:hypothetical protein
MRIQFTLLACLPLSIASCVDTPDHTNGSALSSTPLAGPHIQEVSWTWHGCGPEANPLPFSLVVHVDVDSSSTTYEIKGKAVGCDEFHGNDQLAVCTASPQAIVRVLEVAVGDASGEDTRSIGLNDCVDGKQVFVP